MTTPKPNEADLKRAYLIFHPEFRPTDHARLLEQFAAVRAEERAKVVAEIVAWLGAATEDAAIWAMEIERKWSGK